MTGVLFPSKYEAEDLLALLKDKDSVRIQDLELTKGSLNGVEVFVAIVGIGGVHAARRTRLALDHVPFNNIILAGFAGGLSLSLEVGQILVAQGVSDAELINFLKVIPNFGIAKIHTTSQVVATAAEKAALAEKTGCHAVDMELASVYAVVKESSVDFLCVRVISDHARQDIPAKMLRHGYNPNTGLTDAPRMAKYLITHPWEIMKLKEFMAPLPEVRKKLTHFLVEVLGELG
jgi:nucleoside phosphorylase